jgi:hypothetical protein
VKNCILDVSEFEPLILDDIIPYGQGFIAAPITARVQTFRWRGKSSSFSDQAALLVMGIELIN